MVLSIFILHALVGVVTCTDDGCTVVHPNMFASKLISVITFIIIISCLLAVRK